MDTDYPGNDLNLDKAETIDKTQTVTNFNKVF